VTCGFAVKPKDPPEQSMAAPCPTPILLSVEEEEVMNTSSDTPFLDDFVGERDKEDETKLMGAVKEALAHLVLGRHNRLITMTSINGTHSLLMIIPKHATDSGFHQSARKSKWLCNTFLHA
jgi:hypothetical protein